MKQKLYRAVVQQDDGWFIAEVAGLRAFTGGRGGVVTQGRDLDELAFMVRDAIALLTDRADFSIQLVLPAKLRLAHTRARGRTTRKRRSRAA